MFNDFVDHLKFEFKHHKLNFLLVTFLLLGGLFVRVYRTDMLLKFYYDQGRDALIIRDVYQNLDPVLVGPTTGLAGILRGPAFYYLLLPAYWLSGGSPVVASNYLQVINTFGLFTLYIIAKKIAGRKAGLIAIILMAFSRELIDLSRWLSNPSPIFISVPLMILGLMFIRENYHRTFWWTVVALMLGLNLQFEMASEIWFIPALAILALLYKEFRPTIKEFVLGTVVFLSTLVPQVLFDLLHGGLMRKGIADHFASGKPSFLFDIEKVLLRTSQFQDIYASIYAQGSHKLILIFTALFFLLFIVHSKFRDKVMPLFILFATPFFILLFYHGNEGNFYSYYMIGTFPIFVLLTATTFAKYIRYFPISLLILFFLWVFAKTNFVHTRNFLIAGVDGPTHITLGNQLQAIDWIYKDANGQPFNIDTYVPPVIPYSYEYLYWWRGKMYNTQPTTELLPLLYTLYEVDPPHPERLEAWQERQDGIGQIKQTVQFGGIYVNKRVRKLY